MPAEAALKWIAPFAGFTMAEYFRDRGQHALVVVDDRPATLAGR